jgi:Tfp pilus assembly protein PilN
MSVPNELSFLPDDYLERKSQRRTNAICAILFLVVMVAIGTAFTFTEQAGRRVEAEHATVAKQYADAVKSIQLVQQLTDKQGVMERQAELAASLLEKVPRSRILAEITKALPPGCSLLEFGMDSKPRAAENPAASAKNAFTQRTAPADAKKSAPTLQQPKVYDVTLKITGVSGTDMQVAQFIRGLNQTRIFKDVNLLVTEEYKDSDPPMRKFSLEASLDPNAEVAPDAAKTRTATVEVKENNP